MQIGESYIMYLCTCLRLKNYNFGLFCIMCQIIRSVINTSHYNNDNCDKYEIP